MPVANLRGVNINFQVVGSSGPWATLITGGRRGFAEFVPLAEKLAAHGFQVLLHDRRNTGASDVVLDDAMGEEYFWADDLALLLAHVGAKKAFLGGSSAGARTSILTYLRHPEIAHGLLLMRLTGGAFAAQRLPENYYGQFIKAAQQGGMAAVCATEMYQERITSNPRNRDVLMNTPVEQYLKVMNKWLDVFASGKDLPVMGVTEAQLRGIKVPAIIIPGNDKTHDTQSGLTGQKLIPGGELHMLPIEFRDVPLVPFEEWGPQEAEIAAAFAGFMKKALG